MYENKIVCKVIDFCVSHSAQKRKVLKEHGVKAPNQL